MALGRKETILFGMILWILGAVAIVFPQFSAVSAGSMVGVAFTVAGLAQIAQAFQVKAWEWVCVESVDGDHSDRRRFIYFSQPAR